MPDELKPCPFCQSRNTSYNGKVAHFIRCESCGNNGPTAGTDEYAATLWNTRPIEDALRAENERLKTLVTFAPAYKSTIDMFIIENAKLKARVKAAEELIEAQEYFDAAVGLPECWSDKKGYERDLEKTMTRLRAAREKWGGVSK